MGRTTNNNVFHIDRDYILPKPITIYTYIIHISIDIFLLQKKHVRPATRGLKLIVTRVLIKKENKILSRTKIHVMHLHIHHNKTYKHAMHNNNLNYKTHTHSNVAKNQWSINFYNNV